MSSFSRTYLSMVDLLKSSPEVRASLSEARESVYDLADDLDAVFASFVAAGNDSDKEVLVATYSDPAVYSAAAEIAAVLHFYANRLTEDMLYHANVSAEGDMNFAADHDIAVAAGIERAKMRVCHCEEHESARNRANVDSEGTVTFTGLAARPGEPPPFIRDLIKMIKGGGMAF